MKKTYEEIVQPQKFSVDELFDKRKFVIPIYQRNYAWTKWEIEQLLYDINDIPEKSKEKYYLGSLIVNEFEVNKFEVVDGQQRLTTLFLLLSLLKKQSVGKDSLEFEAREKSNEILQYIYDNADKEDMSDRYSGSIIEGYKVIQRYFKSKDDDFVEKFKEKLNNVMLIITQVPENIDLNNYFEIMNTRGEQLELHEIAKAKIIGAIKSEDNTVSETDKLDKKIAAVIWDACAQMDTYVQMNFPVKKRKRLFGADTWDDFTCNSFEDIRNIFMDDKIENENSFTLRSKLMNPENISTFKQENKEKKNTSYKSIILFPNFILQVNEAMNIGEADDDAGLDDKKFLKLLENRWSSREKALEFIFCLLKYRYKFDRYIIKREYEGQYNNAEKWSLKKLQKSKSGNRNQYQYYYKATIGSNQNDEENEDDDNRRLRLLQSCLRITYTSPKSMHWISRVLAEVCKDGDEKNIIGMLEKYCCKKIFDSDYLRKSGFEIEHIVFTYLDYMLWRDNQKEFKDYQFQFRTSIEHFFPQNPKNGENDVDENHRNNFGNLALITASANSRFSNMLPIHKVEQHKDVIKQSPKLEIMNKLLVENNRVWDNEMVEKHEEEMFELLKTELDKNGYGGSLIYNV